MKTTTVVLTAALLAVGCSSPASPPAADEHTPARTPAAATPLDTTPDILTAITAAGGTCQPLDEHGERDCTLNGIAFKLVPGEAWTQTRDGRRFGCQGGYIAADFQALSDGHWMITTDQPGGLPAIKVALDGQGAVGTLRSYCP